MTSGRHARVVTAALALIAWPCGESMAATLDALAADGVYTWRVAATDDAPPWCCVCWTSGSPVARACDLDSRHSNYSANDEHLAPSGEMQIYALIESGKTQRIRVLSPQCAVTSRRGIVDLGVVEADESLAWLKSHVTSTASASSDALAAIAVHKGSAALRFLVDIADAFRKSWLRSRLLPGRDMLTEYSYISG